MFRNFSCSVVYVCTRRNQRKTAWDQQHLCSSSSTGSSHNGQAGLESLKLGPRFLSTKVRPHTHLEEAHALSRSFGMMSWLEVIYDSPVISLSSSKTCVSCTCYARLPFGRTGHVARNRHEIHVVTHCRRLGFRCVLLSILKRTYVYFTRVRLLVRNVSPSYWLHAHHRKQSIKVCICDSRE
jgi:hypothetical protein